MSTIRSSCRPRTKHKPRWRCPAGRLLARAYVGVGSFYSRSGGDRKPNGRQSRPLWPNNAVRQGRCAVPTQAEKSRPDRNALASATLATSAVANAGPTPGIASSRLLVTLQRCHAMMRRSNSRILAFRDPWQEVARGPCICPKIADDFTINSADNSQALRSRHVRPTRSVEPRGFS